MMLLPWLVYKMCRRRPTAEPLYFQIALPDEQ